MPEHVEIRIRGQLHSDWSQWFGGLTVTRIDVDQTLIAGCLPDQAALHGLLERIRDLNLTLISVICIESSLRDENRIPKGDHHDKS